MDTQTGFASASQRVFPTTVASYLQFRGWIYRKTFCNRSSVTCDLRQCDRQIWLTRDNRVKKTSSILLQYRYPPGTVTEKYA